MYTVLNPGFTYTSYSSPDPAQNSSMQKVPDAGLVDFAKSSIAEYFSVPVQDITLDTDLIQDLKADYMDAFEIVAMICEKKKVVVPTDSELTTVRQIAVYLESAKRKKVSFTLRGRGASSGNNDEPIFTQKVFFATNRRPTGSTDPNTYFNGQRSTLEQGMQYGVCEVTIPVKVHKPGQIEQPFWSRSERDPKQHIVLKGLKVLAWNDFLSTINQYVTRENGDDDWSHDAFVFIHGFNVTFDKAVRRTAQIAYDLGFKGAPVLFSWPSDGSRIKYFSDRIDVEWSVLYIKRFLVNLRAETRAKRIHLIAHSMGNQGLLRALYRIALQQGEKIQPLFDTVIMAAPDFDTRLFTEQIAPRIRPLSANWTIYTSDNDSALDLSALFSSAKRLGKPVSVANGFDTVDVTDIDVSPWSVPEFHSYYASKRRVVADIISVLKNKKPATRKLLPKKFRGIQYWELQ
jgi:esterase/lipase superfamily enzyme/acyl carrier protein